MVNWTPSASCPARSRSCPSNCRISILSHSPSPMRSSAFPELYLQDFGVRELLRISPEEEEWLWKCWGPSQRENNPVFGRLDAMIDFTSPMWKDTLRFVEPNLSGIGGLHLVPTAEGIVAEVGVPVLRESGGALWRGV